MKIALSKNVNNFGAAIYKKAHNFFSKFKKTFWNKDQARKLDTVSINLPKNYLKKSQS